MKYFLFPHFLRPVGWIIFVPAVITGILILTDVFNLGGITETIVIDAIITGIAVSALFISCSRERVEDEMTAAIRLKSLLGSIYAYISLLVVSTLSINGINYIYFMIANLVAFPIIFAVRFRIDMHKYYKENCDEKQD